VQAGRRLLAREGVGVLQLHQFHVGLLSLPV
jgi:hypothetical protein